MDNWVTSVSLILSFLGKAGASYCVVESPGRIEYVYCYQKCCEDYQKTQSNICCAYEYPTTGMIVGGGVGLVTLICTFLLCCMYYFCKKQLQSRRVASRITNPSTNTSITTVSENITLTMSPPSYEEVSKQPPPYQAPPYSAQNLAFVEDGSSSTTEKNYPDHPPPKYSQLNKFPHKRTGADTCIQ